MRCRLGALLAEMGLLLFAGGCGVSDYEARMGQEQSRVEYFDRETLFLEALVKWPEKKDEKKDDKTAPGLAPNEIYFRPPKGIATTPLPAGGNLYRLPAVGATPGLFQEVFLLVVKGKGRDAFRAEVMKDMAAFGAGGTMTEKSLTPPGRNQMRFEHYRNETANLNLFLYQDGDYQAAVGFRALKPDLATMDLSLGTLALGQNAMTQHYQWLLRRPAPGK